MARPTLLEHRKFKRLARTLGSKALAWGSLEMIWSGCYSSGDDYLGDADDVEGAAEWNGESGALTRALLDAGFIETRDEDGLDYYVHDLYDHAPDYVQRRMMREMDRTARGQTISDLRREAGKRGRAVQLGGQETDIDGQASASDGQAGANGGQMTDVCPPLTGNARASVSTPARAPARAQETSATLFESPRAPRFDFEGVYSRYPRKEGKAQGMAKLKARIKSPEDFARFSAAVDGYAAKVKREAIETRFVLQWGTFCNGRWTDYEPGAPALRLVSGVQTEDDAERRRAEAQARFEEEARREAGL